MQLERWWHHDPRQARMRPGEILVCPRTDPGWTPLILAAAAVVMEVGGMTTHGSVVAREHAVPAVVAVHEATTLLKDGAPVRVDCTTGRVTVLGGAGDQTSARSPALRR
jgi:phosphohistidine swiveling domain-containing protein